MLTCREGAAEPHLLKIVGKDESRNCNWPKKAGMKRNSEALSDKKIS